MSPGSDGAGRRSFAIQPELSGVAVRARSNVGNITFVSASVSGTVETGFDEAGGAVLPTGSLQLELGTLQSGNGLYDAELQRRIDARKFPLVNVVLVTSEHAEGTARYHLSAEVTLHGVTRTVDGNVEANLTDEGMLVVDGTKTIDIREFGLSIPSVLMLRIYPQVHVEMHLEAARLD